MSIERFWSFAAVWVLATVVSSCGKPDMVIEEDRYIETMAHLTATHLRFMDMPQSDSAQASVLNNFGISGDDLLEFSEVHGGDLTMMDRVWEAIRLRVAVLENAPVPGSGRAMLRLDSLRKEALKP
jgi:hypothetical protein